MKIVIDTKNFALYGGGIALWFAPLLAAWIEHRQDVQFSLLGPEFEEGFLPRSSNWKHVLVAWPQWLPRPLRHPWYDNVLFPRAVARLGTDLVMSPYHDVRMPKGVPCVITVHDLCLEELVTVYPRRIRLYYLALLRHNLRRASFVLTVSETSRNRLVERYGVAHQRIGVVFNAPPQSFEGGAEAAALADFRKRYGGTTKLLLYPGGSEFRKNVPRLVQAFARLVQGNGGLHLLVTGHKDSRWESALAKLPESLCHRVVFMGRLSDAELCLAYAAADAVAYPSLCEGFGRVCLEAMETGAPLACSDLPVMREVAGDYACYFDPHDVDAMTLAIGAALTQGRHQPRRDRRFQDATVTNSFLAAMDGVLAREMPTKSCGDGHG